MIRYSDMLIHVLFTDTVLKLTTIPMNNTLKVLISEQQLAERIHVLAKMIENHYRLCRQPLVLIGLLKGSFIFLADLCRQLQLPHQIDFITVSSYGNDTVTSGKVMTLQGLSTDLKGKAVIIVEDIVDTGLTLAHIQEVIQADQPASVEICTLISKPSRRQIAIQPKFIGFEIEDIFIVGYGLDYQQAYRHIPYIGYIE